ncbi:4-hydroxythreonine-4-phosphate dehydrogenase PdxA [Marispirochaeta sp.]|jgi:4-phospho-D-threonate 3-dehydrogenase / 4-phospho-D-erythronate 3-dehydrogenase|uniref:4-hydroxythreonine-4-phosphate dehydrogenase PdxA n=1 Tax=Marispirochaeta sp. TaxID=2038653 RepID=UPI0029C757D7|nr:4-hydroxythreonine-4-phosphate dehydrogenase PdxA [Marispirochaeta sp.]
MKTEKRPILGISVGDPAGIGPEITAKALNEKHVYNICKPLAVCDLKVMEAAIEFSGLSLQTRAVSSPAEGKYEYGTIDVLDMRNIDMSKLKYKTVSAMTGKASYEYIEKVIKLAMAKEIDATITGPINKEAINAAGIKEAGHTEIYARLTGTKDYAMMLAEGDFRVVHVSTHVSLQEAINRCKKERNYRVIKLAYDALKRLDIEEPRIAVAGLNPHAGENGMFGREEIDEITPAIEQARAEGINVEGPIPPDTVFSKMKGGQYDIVVVQYHDQGHIPTKLAGFNYDRKTNTWLSMSGVNITLGLPIIRSSVDHGTAFGKAGEGRANPESMLQAIEMGVRMV